MEAILSCVKLGFLPHKGLNISKTRTGKRNGISVLKAKDHVNGKFLLFMSDHLFDEKILEKLVAADVKPGHSTLCRSKFIENILLSCIICATLDFSVAPDEIPNSETTFQKRSPNWCIIVGSLT
jgi:hypothetical protein